MFLYVDWPSVYTQTLRSDENRAPIRVFLKNAYQSGSSENRSFGNGYFSHGNGGNRADCYKRFLALRCREKWCRALRPWPRTWNRHEVNVKSWIPQLRSVIMSTHASKKKIEFAKGFVRLRWTMLCTPLRKGNPLEKVVEERESFGESWYISLFNMHASFCVTVCVQS